MAGTKTIAPAKATGTITVTNYAQLHLTKATGTINKGVYIELPGGVTFPDGCFVDISANVTPSCTLVYEQI